MNIPRMLFPLPALAALATSLVAGTTWAEDYGPPTVDRIFERFDENGDDYLVASEVPDELWPHFKQADTDEDNAVSRDELAAELERRRAR